MPGTFDRERSSGVATDVAIVSGLAPGRLALTWMVGKSTCGRGATGSIGKVTMPIRQIAAISSDVAIGRSINGDEMLICLCPSGAGRGFQPLGYRANL